MTAHISWAEIQNFHNIRKYTTQFKDVLNRSPVVSYKTKIKLHGTNAAVQCHKDGTVVAQSRTAVLSIEKDNCGFAAFVEARKDKFNLKNGFILFGEWIGKNVHKEDVACAKVDKCFVVFGARDMSKEEVFIYEPEQLQQMVKDIPNVHVLPWHSSVDVNWSASDEDMQPTLDKINLEVTEIEEKDPWVESVFGISGVGEGLVFYPVSAAHQGYTSFSNLVFKAKGEKHRVLKTKQAVQVSLPETDSIKTFVDTFVTEARLNQGSNTVGKVSNKNVKKFMMWVLDDVKKESKMELENSKLDWNLISKEIENKSREWYLSKVKESDRK